MGVGHEVVSGALQAQAALQRREELLTLYRLIACRLREAVHTDESDSAAQRRRYSVTRKRCRVYRVRDLVVPIQDDAHVHFQNAFRMGVPSRHGNAVRQLPGAKNGV
jgi:hypothetical protein